MKKILVKMDYCWSDEFDVKSLWVTTKEEFDKFKDELLKLDINEDVEIYFGTNEFVSFYSAEDIINSLIVTEISEDFYNEFIKNIGENYGLIEIPYLLEHYYEEE